MKSVWILLYIYCQNEVLDSVPLSAVQFLPDKGGIITDKFFKPFN